LEGWLWQCHRLLFNSAQLCRRQAHLSCVAAHTQVSIRLQTLRAALPLRAALKTALSGLELLLARAQLWEQTAAAHVSLAAVLRPVAGLASRWRRLELASWKGLLDRTVAAFAEGKRIRDLSAGMMYALCT
jgi:midasin (ATPase involved in ribosome maturation)